MIVFLILFWNVCFIMLSRFCLYRDIKIEEFVISITERSIYTLSNTKVWESIFNLSLRFLVAPFVLLGFLLLSTVTKKTYYNLSVDIIDLDMKEICEYNELNEDQISEVRNRLLNIYYNFPRIIIGYGE